ncbi:hypothetical protein [Alkalihalobacillus sp. R86527]|uniref:hypothetical protein n=1 Tax=Alkalihalobacillus sp. R86527 TaxID=3093863 RepID=UPI00366D9A63
MTIKYSVCPVCGSKQSARIIYGMPTRDVLPQVERGEVLLGGGSLPTLNKEYHCKSCEFEWSRDEAVAHAYRKINKVKAYVGGFFGCSYQVEWVLKTGEVTYLEWENSMGEDPITINTIYENLHSIDSLQSTNVLRWKKDYQPEQPILDGTSWSVEIQTDDKVIEKHGSNAYPKTWDQFCELMEEVSGKTFR